VRDNSGRRTSIERFDVVVSGASCAGLLAAEKLAVGGRDVVVLERKWAPQAPKRTWIVTDRIRTILGELPPNVVVHQTGVMEVSAGEASVSVALDPPDLIVERSALLRYLATRATAAGVQIRVNADVTEFRLEEDRIVLDVLDRRTNGTYQVHSRELIGAGGTNCQIARSLSTGPQRVVPVVQVVVDLPKDYDPNVTKVWFDRAGTKYFFWLIPESPSTGVVGLIAETSSNARNVLHDFLRRDGFRPLSYQGAMIPLHQPTRSLEWRSSGCRVLLVGDAASHVKVTTVGGVVSGLWGAEAAARSLLRGTPYRRELRALHRELYLHDFIRWSLDRFDQKMYEEMIRMMNDPLRILLGSQNRDSMAGAILGLISRQPRILRLVLRSVFLPHRSPEPQRAPRRPASMLSRGSGESGD
jgi:flavin-dependent dehydrogenase